MEKKINKEREKELKKNGVDVAKLKRSIKQKAAHNTVRK